MPLAFGLALLLASPAPAPRIEILRDEWGVPSISAANLNDAMYALGYLHITDDGAQTLANFRFAEGRTAETSGRSGLLVDSILRGFEFEEHAAQAKLPPAAEAMLAAYIQGINKGIADHRSQFPADLPPVTRTDVLSFVQFVNCAFPLLDLASALMPGVGSNQFAVAGSRTSTGSPILSIDPHLDWNGGDGGILWYESAIYIPGMSFRGVSIPGLPCDVMGHNDRVAWSITNNDPRLFVRYTVETNPANKTEYSYHGVWKPFREKPIVMRYLDPATGALKEQKQTLRLTEWGPMVPFRNEAVYLEPVGNFNGIPQLPAMMSAKSIDEFRKSMNYRGLSMWNFVAADTGGALLYQYNAFLHRRDGSLDWSKPVSGADPKTKLGDLLTLDDLPHSVRPSSGLLINANSSPWLTPTDDSMPAQWPAYITSDPATSRYLRLRELLKGASKIDPAAAQKIATDTEVPGARDAVAALRRAGATGEAADLLDRWNGRADVDSVGPALYLYLLNQHAGNDPAALDRAAQALKKDFGTLDVKWGDLLRMKQGSKEIGVAGWGYPIPGAGSAVCPSGPSRPGKYAGGPMIAGRGSSFRMIVSLVPGKVQSWSILPYGNAHDPQSPFATNQMDIYAVGKYKATYFGLDAARKAAKSSMTLSR